MGDVRVTVECHNRDKMSCETISMEIGIVDDLRYMNDFTSIIRNEIIKAIYDYKPSVIGD